MTCLPFQHLRRTQTTDGHPLVRRGGHPHWLEGSRKAHPTHVTTIPLLIIDDLGMRKLPQTAAEDLLEIIMRRYERALPHDHVTSLSESLFVG